MALSDACDGHRDCRDGSDEGLLCGEYAWQNVQLIHIMTLVKVKKSK